MIQKWLGWIQGGNITHKFIPYKITYYQWLKANIKNIKKIQRVISRRRKRRKKKFLNRVSVYCKNCVVSLNIKDFET
jgi:hypothetical protein